MTVMTLPTTLQGLIHVYARILAQMLCIHLSNCFFLLFNFYSVMKVSERLICAGLKRKSAVMGSPFDLW